MEYELKVSVGNDIGNSEHDIIINGDIFCQPNVFAKILQIPAAFEEELPEEIIKKIDNNIVTTINSDCLPPNSTYYCGVRALNSGKPITNIQVGAGNDKSKSDVILVNTLAQIAKYATKLMYVEDVDLRGKTCVKADMAISVPVGLFSKQVTKRIIDKFYGIHEVIVHLGARSAKIEIEFEVIKVMPESIASIFYLVNLPSGHEIFGDKLINGSHFKNKKILHIAIGEGTTEFPITENVDCNIDFVRGSNNGIGHAIEIALPEFMERVNLRSFTRQNYSAILKNGAHKYFQIANELLEIPLENEAISISKIAEAEIEKSNNEVDIILVHGGGSITLEKFLRRRLDMICSKLNIELFYIPKNEAVTLEAKGLYEFTKSKMFENAKKIEMQKKYSK